MGLLYCCFRWGASWDDESLSECELRDVEACMQTKPKAMGQNEVFLLGLHSTNQRNLERTDGCSLNWMEVWKATFSPLWSWRIVKQLYSDTFWTWLRWLLSMRSLVKILEKSQYVVWDVNDHSNWHVQIRFLWHHRYAELMQQFGLKLSNRHNLEELQEV